MDLMSNEQNKHEKRNGKTFRTSQNVKNENSINDREQNTLLNLEFTRKPISLVVVGGSPQSAAEKLWHE